MPAPLPAIGMGRHINSDSSYLEHLSKHGMCQQRLRDVAARIYKLSVSMDLEATEKVSMKDLETFADEWAYRENPWYQRYGVRVVLEKKCFA